MVHSDLSSVGTRKRISSERVAMILDVALTAGGGGGGGEARRHPVAQAGGFGASRTRLQVSSLT
jgi:hypothetical protein